MINYFRKRKKPEILTILNVEFPFINKIFIDKAINKLIYHNYKKSYLLSQICQIIFMWLVEMV